MIWPFGALRPFSFDLVVADPAWPWETYSAKGQEKSPEAQYQTMSLDDIAALPIGDLLAPGGALICWATWPLVATGEVQRCMTGWGLPPVTGGAWGKRTASGKLRWGTGYRNRSLCEPYFIAALPGAPVVNGRKFPNLIETMVDELEAVSFDGLAREHSRKPDEFYTLLEALSPGARRLELYSRVTRQGWAGFGNEATKFDGAAA
ncbi:MAG TPA: MT-A70 family methyltransferase [Pseudolabrys sp.]